MEWEEPDGRPSLFPSLTPYTCWTYTQRRFILLEMVGLLVMVGLVKLVMMKEKEIISLSGPGQTHVSMRYRAQCSKEDAVRRILISSEGSG